MSMVETTETVETAADVTIETEDTNGFDEAFDSEWGDDSVSEESSDDMDGFDLSDDEAEPDQAEAESTTTETAEEPAAEAKTEEQPAEAEKADQLFTLKHLDEVREVGRDEVITLAQKGMDYDRIRSERDALKSAKDGDSAALKELAEANGMTVAEYIESSRVSIVLAKARADGTPMTRAEALKQVRAEHPAVEEKTEAPAEAPTATEAPAEDKAAEARHSMIRRFVDAHPDVKADSIPQSVWDEAIRTQDLVGAYDRYENRQLRERIAALEQNKKNAERSTGSRATAGATSAAKDPFDDAWDSFS